MATKSRKPVEYLAFSMASALTDACPGNAAGKCPRVPGWLRGSQRSVGPGAAQGMGQSGFRCGFVFPCVKGRGWKNQMRKWGAWGCCLSISLYVAAFVPLDSTCVERKQPVSPKQTEAYSL